jgi:hypothetical protein
MSVAVEATDVVEGDVVNGGGVCSSGAAAAMLADPAGGMADDAIGSNVLTNIMTNRTDDQRNRARSIRGSFLYSSLNLEEARSTSKECTAWVT